MQTNLSCNCNEVQMLATRYSGWMQTPEKTCLGIALYPQDLELTSTNFHPSKLVLVSTGLSLQMTDPEFLFQFELSSSNINMLNTGD